MGQMICDSQSVALETEHSRWMTDWREVEDKMAMAQRHAQFTARHEQALETA